MRDYLFDARTGYYVVDKPTGWEWGSAELDPAAFTIVRTGGIGIAGIWNNSSTRCKSRAEVRGAA